MAKKHTTRYLSAIQEKATAKELGGWRTPNSGALSVFPGDVRTGELLVECKVTGKKYYRLALSTWEKIRREAISCGLRVPLMKIGLLNGRIEKAVFETGSFADYRLIHELSDAGDTVFAASGSVRVTELSERVIAGRIGLPAAAKAFDVVGWGLFLEILRGGKCE
jgi:hypothetical protein